MSVYCMRNFGVTEGWRRPLTVRERLRWQILKELFFTPQKRSACSVYTKEYLVLYIGVFCGLGCLQACQNGARDVRMRATYEARVKVAHTALSSIKLRSTAAHDVMSSCPAGEPRNRRKRFGVWRCRAALPSSAFDIDRRYIDLKGLNIAFES